MPRPATEPWRIPNPKRIAKVTIASVLPAILAIAITLIAQLDPAIGMLLVFLPLQIVASVWVGRNIYGRKGQNDALLVVFTIFFSAFVAVLLVSVILIVGALTFFPALSLGPIVEHLLMGAGKTF